MDGSEESGLIDRKDPDSVLGVTRLIESGMLALAKSDLSGSCSTLLPKAVHALVPHLAADQDGVRFGTSQALRNLFLDCIDDMTLAKAAAVSPSAGKPAPGIQTVVAAVVGALGARYEESWPLGLAVAATLIERLGKHPSGPILSTSLLTSIGDILEGAQEAAEEEEEEGGLLAAAAGSGGGGVRAAAESALGSALRSLGPAAVLHVLPLNLQGILGQAPSLKGVSNLSPSGGAPRTWLLPLLRKHVRGAQLSYWGKAMLPLARDMAARGESAAAVKGAGSGLAQACHLLEQQIWACLPSFCSWVTDLPTAYAPFVKDIAAAFQNREDLRPCISRALERMCSQVTRVL